MGMDLFLGLGLVVGCLCEDVVFGVMAFSGVNWQFVGRVDVGLELLHQTSFHHYKIIRIKMILLLGRSGKA